MVELQLPRSMQNHKVFNVTKLCPFNSPIPGQAPSPPPTPVVTSTGAEYYVESLLDSHMFRGRHQYLVCWKGYDTSKDTWEPKSNIPLHFRTHFHCQHSEAPQELSVLEFSNLNFKKLENFTKATSLKDFYSKLNIPIDDHLEADP